MYSNMLKRTYLHACFTVPEREKCVWTTHRGYRIQFAGLYLNVKPLTSHSRYHSSRFYFADVVPQAGTILCVKCQPFHSACIHRYSLDSNPNMSHCKFQYSSCLLLQLKERILVSPYSCTLYYPKPIL